jgi:hypothetical protein
MTAQTDHSEAVQAVEQRLEEANERADLPALEAMLADTFLYTGGMGGSQSKAEWLGELTERRQSADTKSREAKTAEMASRIGRGTVLLLTGLRVGESTDYAVEIHGEIAVANRRYAIVNPDGTERCLRYVRVYRRAAAGWQLLSHRYIHAVD